MKFVALVSGGKDSCYNSMECVRHGHELVCLANLYPPVAVSDEADSFMYQSAAHTAIEAQAECFGKPLVRRELKGRAVNQSLQYCPTEEDEVEDLFLLLKEVKERFPEVTAVGSGAILSNYQRTRVENVCGRLGLTSLAYLWRRPQSPLLAEMVDAGLDAVLVKVASFGLEPSKHLGRSLVRLRPFFESLHSRCGFHVCGEGGEYETLTLDCPLFVRKLVLDETVVVNHSDDMFAPVGLLRVVKCHTEPKPPPAVPESASRVDAAAAPSLNRCIRTSADGSKGGGPGMNGADPKAPASAAAAVAAGKMAATRAGEGDGEKISVENTAAGTTTGWVDEPKVAAAAAASAAASVPSSPAACCLPHVHEGSGGLVYLSGVRRSRRVDRGEERAAAEAAIQAADCLAVAREALGAVGVSFRDVCFVHLYLRDMGHFSAVNEEYCRWFQGENPPSRSCVSVPLPPSCSVMLDVVALRGSGAALSNEGAACARRQVLHVRSISSWAPVCIGPYCQANTLGPSGGIALIAGQIGLQPASMTFPARPSSAHPSLGAGRIHERELSLCVSHASSVASAVGASVSRGCLFATLFVSQEAAAAADIGGTANTPGAMATVTDAPGKNGGGGSGGWLRGMIEECRALMEARSAQEQAEAAAEAAGTGGAGGEDDDSAEEGWTSDPEELSKEAARKMVLVRSVPILAVVVPSLPKNATVELEVMCMSRAALSILPCQHFKPSTRVEFLAASPSRTARGQGHPVPGRFIPPPTPSAAIITCPDTPATLASGSKSNGDCAAGAAGGGALQTAASLKTTGSTVDRVLAVAVSSLSVMLGGDDAAVSAAAAAGAGASTANAAASASADADADAGGYVSVLSGAQLEQAMGLALAEISGVVSAARLRWSDVANLRVYYHSPAATNTAIGTSDSGSNAMRGTGRGIDEEMVKRAMFLALAGATRERPAVTFVPVSGLDSGAAVSFHATAWDLDRLRTELWVRGAA